METKNDQQIEEQNLIAEEQRLQLESLLEEKKAVRWYVMRAYKCDRKKTCPLAENGHNRQNV